MSGLIYLNLHSRKVCMGFSTSHCCNDPVLELDRFTTYVLRDGDANRTRIVEYPMFEINDQGQMCVLLDDEMHKLCSGRYLFEVVLDDCVHVVDVPFMWGGTPVLTSVSLEEKSGSVAEGCLDDEESGNEATGKLPKNCCEPCPEPQCPEPCEEECVPLAEHTPNGEYDSVGCCEN